MLLFPIRHKFTEQMTAIQLEPYQNEWLILNVTNPLLKIAISNLRTITIFDLLPFHNAKASLAKKFY